MLLLAQDVADVETRARFDALRRACRALDEAWTTTPRGELSSRFAATVAPEVRAIVAAIRSPDAA
jgi:putative intracellular protease/amidase